MRYISPPVMLHSLYITAEKCQIYVASPAILTTVNYYSYTPLLSPEKNARLENFTPFLAAQREV